MATYKPGIHISLFGWSPKYPPQLVQYANSLLRDKIQQRDRLGPQSVLGHRPAKRTNVVHIVDGGQWQV
jgi:hypothetical protein